MVLVLRSLLKISAGLFLLGNVASHNATCRRGMEVQVTRGNAELTEFILGEDGAPD